MSQIITKTAKSRQNQTEKNFLKRLKIIFKKSNELHKDYDVKAYVLFNREEKLY